MLGLSLFKDLLSDVCENIREHWLFVAKMRYRIIQTLLWVMRFDHNMAMFFEIPIENKILVAYKVLLVGNEILIETLRVFVVT